MTRTILIALVLALVACGGPAAEPRPPGVSGTCQLAEQWASVDGEVWVYLLNGTNAGPLVATCKATAPDFATHDAWTCTDEHGYSMEASTLDGCTIASVLEMPVVNVP